MSVHVYNISDDFPNQNVLVHNLGYELEASSIGRDYSFEVTTDTIDVTITATPDVTDPADIAVIDTVVANHQGGGVFYIYEIANDFPNQAVNDEVLVSEIEASSLGPGHGVSVSHDANKVYVQTTPELTPAEIVILDGVIASHQGVPFVNGIQRKTVNPEQTNTTTTWQSVATLNSGPLRAGSYLINVSCEIKSQTTDNTSGTQMRVLYNGSEVSTSARHLIVYDGCSISAPVDLVDGSSPVVEVQFRRVGTSNTAYIRRTRISMSRLQGVVNEV